MSWLAGLLGLVRKIPAWLWAALGLLLALVFAYRRGQGRGLADRIKQEDARRGQNRRIADEVEDRNRRLGADERRRRLRDWAQD